jgi:SAM-dependent methyltransferase
MTGMLYAWKVRWLKTRRGNLLWRRWQVRRGAHVGDVGRLPDLIRTHASGQSFVDIGCMWGVHGAYAFLAEEAGAKIVRGVDVFGPTPEFEATKAARRSSVEFILGDCTDPATIARVGVMDVVLCSGVLYHHPNPYTILAALRQMCGRILILRTATIPEIDGLPNAAVYFPMLGPAARGLWDLSRLGVAHQAGISDAFDPAAGYGNWFWGLTPSCLAALVETAGFEIESRATEAFAQTFICRPVRTHFAAR